MLPLFFTRLFFASIFTCKWVSAGSGTPFTGENAIPLIAEVHLQVKMAFRW